MIPDAHHCHIAGSLGSIVADILAVSLALLDVDASAILLAVGVAPVVVTAAVLHVSSSTLVYCMLHACTCACKNNILAGFQA
jgi:hypothetical protein